MNKILSLLAIWRLSAASVFSAESPEALLKEISAAFETQDSTALSNRQFCNLITGDIPVLSGPLPPADLEQLGALFPSKYDVTSVALISATEGKALLIKNHSCIGYVRVDFKRKEDVPRKAQITAFARLYPYIPTDDGIFLINPK